MNNVARHVLSYSNNAKPTYEKPTMQIALFKEEDIVRTSGEGSVEQLTQGDTIGYDFGSWFN